MKQILTILSVTTLFLACNNATKEEVVPTANLSADEKAMKDAITAYPDSMLLRETLIQYYQDNGSIEAAFAELNTAIQKDSNDARLWDKKGELFIGEKDTSNAIKAYEKAIEIYPDPVYIMTIGWIYAQKKDSMALAMADALIVGKNAHAEKEALLIKGLYYSATGNKPKAISFFDNCLALDYTFMQAYREKAIIFYDMAKYEDAIAVLNKAITLQNNFAEGYYWLGKCLEKVNNTNDAINSYRLALQYDPEYTEAKDALGKLGIK